ncbi:hypothetical protein L7F22_008755 [Adiantum nelumboides]|nr:hypothetical protein [Adiantum nelumboides]
MGWNGKLANKVGHYLSQSLEFPLKHLYTYPSPSRSGESSSVGDGFQECQQSSGTGIETVGGMEEEYGPDTSLLTAFLLSLLSSSNNSSRRSSDSPEQSDTEQDGDPRSSLSRLRGPNKSNDDSRSNKAIALLTKGSTAKHGISLQTMYRKSAALPDPFLLG